VIKNGEKSKRYTPIIFLLRKFQAIWKRSPGPPFAKLLRGDEDHPPYGDGKNSGLQSILEWTLDASGRPAMERYSRLIGQALLDLAEDPGRPGSQHAADALFIYHLSRTRGRNLHVHRPGISSCSERPGPT
jgi:hypothetical protein